MSVRTIATAMTPVLEVIGILVAAVGFGGIAGSVAAVKSGRSPAEIRNEIVRGCLAGAVIALPLAAAAVILLLVT